MTITVTLRQVCATDGKNAEPFFPSLSSRRRRKPLAVGRAAPPWGSAATPATTGGQASVFVTAAKGRREGK